MSDSDVPVHRKGTARGQLILVMAAVDVVVMLSVVFGFSYTRAVWLLPFALVILANLIVVAAQKKLIYSQSSMTGVNDYERRIRGERTGLRIVAVCMGLLVLCWAGTAVFFVLFGGGTVTTSTNLIQALSIFVVTANGMSAVLVKGWWHLEAMKTDLLCADEGIAQTAESEGYAVQFVIRSVPLVVLVGIAVCIGVAVQYQAVQLYWFAAASLPTLLTWFYASSAVRRLRIARQLNMQP